MAKFPRVPQDRYLTPWAATLPLAPFLSEVGTFAEPCCADRGLVQHIEGHGPLCIHADDLSHGTDALTDPVLKGLIVDRIITNPPYSWPVLKRMIPLFFSIAPTWLLLEERFKYNERCQRFMAHCSRIVAVGRVQWFPGTDHASRVNYEWYEFVPTARNAPPLFHPNPLTRREVRSLSALRTLTPYLTKEIIHHA